MPWNATARKGVSTGLSKSFDINGRKRRFDLPETNSF
jgi:hypothetical protein